MDLKALELDWKEDPALSRERYPNVEQLADHLRSVHKYLTDPEAGGPMAYLYRKQIERNRKLQKELDHEREQNNR